LRDFRDESRAIVDYDNYNLLQQINWPDETNTQFVSDAAGKRVSLTTSGQTEYKFVYDTTARIPAVLLEQKVVQETVVANKLYIRTPDGRLIARVTPGESPSLDFYYHFDGLGSTLALTNASGTQTDSYKYDAWGNIVLREGGAATPFQYVGGEGYYTDADTGLLKLGARYYDPTIGRFVSKDPSRDGLNWYEYAGNNPANAVDPGGMEAVKVVSNATMLKQVRGSIQEHRLSSIAAHPGPS